MDKNWKPGGVVSSAVVFILFFFHRASIFLSCLSFWRELCCRAFVTLYYLMDCFTWLCALFFALCVCRLHAFLLRPFDCSALYLFFCFLPAWESWREIGRVPHCLCMSLLQLAATTSPMSLSVTCVASFVLLRQQPQHCIVHLLSHISQLPTALNKHSRERERERARACLQLSGL